MSLLEIKELSHTFGDYVVYKDASLTVNKGEHIGVVGHNGAGKSTLIKICSDLLIPDSGIIQWQPNISIGYLDQYAELNPELTMRQFLKAAFKTLFELEKKMIDCYAEAARGKLEALNQAATYQEILEKENFYMIDTQIERVAEGLGLNEIGLDRPLAQMSGGQRAKVILGKLLLEKPDVLLLDEPTNFLDSAHIAWLSEYLFNLEKTFLTVSHDYQFLDKISNRICDIENKKIIKYEGSYSAFLEKKRQRRENYIRQYQAQQREIKKTEAFIRKNIAGRKSKMAKGRRKQLERMEKMEALEKVEVKPRFFFPSSNTSQSVYLTVDHLSIGYRAPILSNLDFSIKGGDKVVITGFNGVGKSTLLKTLMGQVPALEGQFTFSDQAITGYCEQDLEWRDEKRTPIEIVLEQHNNLTTKEIRQKLSQCGISNEHAQQAIGTLSGGEQAKVRLCLLTLMSCNFLIMDEPTSHLDTFAKASLRKALIDFPGAVLLVSHEEMFYRGWAHRMINIEKMDDK